MFIGIIAFYHFIPLSITLTWAGDHKVSAKQHLFFFHFFTHCSTDQSEICYGIGAIQNKHADTSFDWDLVEKGKQQPIYCVHHNVYEMICCKLGLKLASIEL